MNNVFYEMIFKRKSFHVFRNVGNESISEYELKDIQDAYSGFIPLNSEIKTAIRIIPEKETNCKRGGEYCILLYSEKKDGYLQNIGYLGEQLDLYLVSRNIGTLWFGIGKTKEEPFEDMEFVIMLSIRKISDDSKYRKDMFKSKRKSIEEIWEGEQISGVTDIVRFAPSACNSQPWLVKNDGELLVYRYKKPGKRGIMPADKVSFYNCIDMGIFICFMDICLGHRGINFDKILYPDTGEDKEYVLNARYRLESVTKSELIKELTDLGVKPGMILEVHSSLSSFGNLEGGAMTLIDVLKELVTEEGSIFMPALRLSKELELTEEDKKMGITVKIKVLDKDAKKTAMGAIADTFRMLPDTVCGDDTISTAGWGKHAEEAVKGGLDYAIHNGGKALMFGVDIYKLTAMHYMEGATPEDINKISEPTEEINKKYPPKEWFMEAGHPPVKAWYRIQEKAYERGLIKEAMIGNCKVMFFDILDVVSIYENELKNNPYELWGLA